MSRKRTHVDFSFRKKTFSGINKILKHFGRRLFKICIFNISTTTKQGSMGKILLWSFKGKARKVPKIWPFVKQVYANNLK